MLLSILHLIGQDRSWSRDDHIVFLGGDLDSSAAPRSNVTSWTPHVAHQTRSGRCYFYIEPASWFTSKLIYSLCKPSSRRDRDSWAVRFSLQCIFSWRSRRGDPDLVTRKAIGQLSIMYDEFPTEISPWHTHEHSVRHRRRALDGATCRAKTK